MRTSQSSWPSPGMVPCPLRLSASALPWACGLGSCPSSPNLSQSPFPKVGVPHPCDALEFSRGLRVEVKEPITEAPRFELEYWSSSPATDGATLFLTLERVPGLSEWPCYHPDPKTPGRGGATEACGLVEAGPVASPCLHTPGRGELI